MDISKISPAPWRYDIYSNDIQIGDGTETVSKIVVNGKHDSVYSDEETMSVCDAEFIALARSAFDVMMRRGWNPYRISGRWHINSGNDGCCMGRFEEWLRDMSWDDPFTALVEADKWFKENVDKK